MKLDRQLRLTLPKNPIPHIDDHAKYVTFSFSFSIYTMPSPGIELCYHSHEGLGSFHTVRKPLRDFPLSSILRRVGVSLLDLPHLLIIPTPHYFPIRLPGMAPKAYL